MAKITYEDKVALNENPEIALINKVTDDDLNEIKSVVNTNDDNVGNLTNLTTTTKTNIVAAVNEINSNAASATDLGDISDLTTTDKTSAVNAINELNSDKAADDIILVQSTEPSSDTNILWINDGQIGTPVSEITNSYSTSTGIGYSANFINGDVLFETEDQNPLGISDNITLSASIDNYRMIEIQYNRYGYLGYVKVPTDIRLSTAPNSILVNCDLSLFANNILRIYTTTYVLSGTSMSRSSYTYWNTNQGAPTANAENQLTVTKVIGYK